MRLLVMADGRSIHTRRWREFFENEGWIVGIFTLEPDRKENSENTFSAGRPTGIGLIDYRLALSALRRTLDRFKPDLISAHYVVSYGWLASFIPNLPTVVTVWGSDLLILPQRSFVHRRRINRALAHAALCTVDNHNLYEAARNYISDSKIVMAPMGVDRYWFDQVQRTEFNTDRPLRIVAPRGLEAVYDPNTIVNTAIKVGRHVSCQIDMFGRPDKIPLWQKKADALGLQGTLNFRPFLPHQEYLGLLSDYDIYLSASLSDSTSVALLEGMAAGLYPIVSDIEGNREWITHGRNGLLFKPQSAEALAEMISQADRDRQRLSAAANINRALVADRAIWQNSMVMVKNCMLQLVR